MPTRRNVSDSENRRVELHNLTKADDSSVFLAGILESQELPTLIVSVVCDMQNRSAFEDDLTERNHGTIRWLIEWPLFIHGVGRPTGPHGRRRSSRLMAAVHVIDSTRDSIVAHRSRQSGMEAGLCGPGALLGSNWNSEDG
jgi:hypothetical protein